MSVRATVGHPARRYGHGTTVACDCDLDRAGAAVRPSRGAAYRTGGDVLNRSAIWTPVRASGYFQGGRQHPPIARRGHRYRALAGPRRGRLFSCVTVSDPSGMVALL